MVRIPLARAPLVYSATRYRDTDLIQFIRGSCIGPLLDVAKTVDGQLHYELKLESKVVVFARSGRSNARLTVDLMNGIVTHNLAYFQRPGSSDATVKRGDVPTILSERSRYHSYNDYFHVLEDWWSFLQTHLAAAHMAAPRLAEIRGKQRGELDTEVLGDQIWSGVIDWTGNTITVPSASLPSGRKSSGDQIVYENVYVTYLGDRPLPAKARRKERVEKCRLALVALMKAEPERHSGVREAWWRILSQEILGLNRAEYDEAWLVALAVVRPGEPARWSRGGRPRGSKVTHAAPPAEAPRQVRRQLALARQVRIAERVRINVPAPASVVNASGRNRSKKPQADAENTHGNS